MADEVNQEIALSRAELHSRVWSTPTSKLSREFGISDVAIGKICKKHRIPKPSLGYWARIQHGQSPPITPLPEETNPSLQTIRIDPGLGAQKITPLDDKFERLVSREGSPENRIQVPQHAGRFHPLISATRSALKSARCDNYGLLYHFDEGCLDVQVGKSSINRAMHLMNSLVLALEKRGYVVKSKQSEKGQSTIVEIEGEPVHIWLREEIKRTPYVPTKEEKEKARLHKYDFYRKYSYNLTRRLILHLETDIWTNGYRKKWGESDSERLEDTLNSFVVGLVKAAFAGKLARAEREERNKEYEKQREVARQQEAVRAEEAAKVVHLERLVAAWNKSQNLREFIVAVERNETNRNGAIASESEVAKWVKWAKAYADSIDPSIVEK